MSIISFETTITGQIGVVPRRVTLVVTDSLDAITVTGFMNTAATTSQVNSLQPSDVLEVLYDYDPASQLGTYGIFRPYFLGSQIVLIPWLNPANVLLPVTVGALAAFVNTLGTIGNAVVSPSSAVLPTLASVQGPVSTARIVTFNDANGTIQQNSGTVVSGNGSYGGGSSSFSIGAPAVTPTHNLAITMKSSVTGGAYMLTAVCAAPNTINIVTNVNPGVAVFTYVAILPT